MRNTGAWRKIRVPLRRHTRGVTVPGRKVPEFLETIGGLGWLVLTQSHLLLRKPEPFYQNSTRKRNDKQYFILAPLVRRCVTAEERGAEGRRALTFNCFLGKWKDGKAFFPLSRSTTKDAKPRRRLLCVPRFSGQGCHARRRFLRRLMRETRPRPGGVGSRLSLPRHRGGRPGQRKRGGRCQAEARRRFERAKAARNNP
ncbi:hypothetical protein NHX12_028838 [Muraenolepis orangiensis]|uniref:Uncharacterized protein n=1 Tax=Muraenolepis orangiensis TaxID=630683 RepID=A0A9Q0EGL8_9TELE|nr:hypothetical protein NHX12_028838 [Muraenolepis orangiensis]